MWDEILEPIHYLQKNPKIMLGLVLTFLILIAMTFAKTIMQWHQDFSKPEVITTSVEVADNTSINLIAELPNRHLFGQALAADDFLPVTSLQLHLTGIIRDDNVHKSQAIIAAANEAGKIYAVGDELTSGIKIYAINDDGIVLEHSGHLEKLPLVRNQLTFQDPPKSLWNDQSSA